MSGRQRLVNFIKDYKGINKFKIPTPNCKIHNGNGLRTVFYTLQDAIDEGKKLEDEDIPFPTITFEKNGYYRFYGHGHYAYKNGNYFDV
jgi:hypothetical protein